MGTKKCHAQLETTRSPGWPIGMAPFPHSTLWKLRLTNYHPGAPRGFSGNMLQLALIIKGSLQFDAERIFAEIA